MAGRAVALAPAKINLGLEVLGRRPDGYHEIATILQTVTLCDRFEWRDTGSAFVYASAPGIDPEADLVARALATASDRARWTGQLQVQKRIPISAGLGGGSSNAALALRLALPDAPMDTLAALAATLGSDIPFFLHGGTALATGTGTTITPVATPELWFVIVTPPVQIPSKTATQYRALRETDFTDGSKVSGLVETLSRAQALTQPPPNAFERQLRTWDAVERAWDALERAGAPWVSVSGAGPSIFTAVSTFQEALTIRMRLTNDIGVTHVAQTLSPSDQDIAAENLARRIRGGGSAR